MAERTDITVDWGLSPRLIEVALPSVELSNQDLHDTLNSNTLQPGQSDDSLDNMDDDFIIDSAGKEDLGGGTAVGITSTLFDGQVAFGRTSPRSTTTETVTTGGTNSFIALGANFIGDGVARGDWVINWTDFSVSEVLLVISATELRVRTPTGLAAASNDFAVNDVITVWEVAECELGGGNTVAEDDVGAPINPLFTTFGRFATRTSSSSATLQELEDIQYASFDGAIHINVADGAAGTAYPLGTERSPVNNLTDALAINAVREFDALHIHGPFTFGATDNIDGFVIEGETATYNLKKTDITLTAGVSTSGTEFHDLYITGTQGGESIYRDCILEDLVDSHCSYHDCGFIGTITMPAGGGFNTHTKDVIDCHTGRTNLTWDLNGTGMDYRFVRFSGDLTFTNGTNASSVVELHMQGGTVTIDASCTGTTFNITGDGKIINNSVGAVVNDNGTYTKLLELWSRLGLNPDEPMTTDDDNNVVVGGITLTAVNTATETTQTRTGSL